MPQCRRRRGKPRRQEHYDEERHQNLIVFNDDSKSLHIEDPSGNTWDMDGQGNIAVYAPNKITLNATDIELNTANSVAINAGNSVVVNAMTGFFVFTAYLKQIVSGMMNLFSRKTLISSKEDIAIEAKDAKLHGTESTLVHSDKQAVINSKDEVQVHGNNGTKHDNKAKDVDTSPSEVIGLAKVLFRATSAWNGEYGFDWLREEDDGLAPATEPAYGQIIQGGYGDGTTDLTAGETGTAYAQLQQTEYHSIPLQQVQVPNTPQNYFVPYLTLFSQEFVSKFPAKMGTSPQCQATLQLLVEVDADEPLDKLEFDMEGVVGYNKEKIKDLFTITPATLTNTSKTKLVKAGTVTITCLKDLESDTEINIYAYPKGSTQRPEWEQLILRKLAGRVIVLKNDAWQRKEQKFVLVPIKTNIHGTSVTKPAGAFTASEQQKLQDVLYQNIVLSSLEPGTALDLSNDPKFQIKTDAQGNNTNYLLKVLQFVVLIFYS